MCSSLFFFSSFIVFLSPLVTQAQQLLSPAPKVIALTASNPSTASGDISFYSNGCRMTITFDLSTDTGKPSAGYTVSRTNRPLDAFSVISIDLYSWFGDFYIAKEIGYGFIVFFLSLTRIRFQLPFVEARIHVTFDSLPDYVGQWTSTTTFVITVVDWPGAAPPQVL
jgi:hypothetical protein